MKKNFTLFAVLVGGVMAMSSFVVIKNYLGSSEMAALVAPHSSGPQASKTGAPSEQNCTQCHSGTAQSGVGTNTISFAGGSSYFWDSTYNMSVSMVSASNVNGFQIVALDATDNMAGSWTITDAANTQTISGMSRTYVNHTSAGTGLTTWNFDWTAPSSDVGDVTFYLATNLTNNSGSNSGDAIYLSQLTISSDASNGISEHDKLQAALNIYKNRKGQFDINFETFEAADCMLKAFDIEGRLLEVVDLGTLGAGTHRRTLDLDQKGIVIFNLFIDNNVLYQKVGL